MLKIKYSYKNLLLFLASASALALIMAYVSQYIFGLKPCILCLHQRKPFFIIIAISAIFLLIGKLKKQQSLAILLVLIMLLINAGIATYHAGVEYKVFAGPDTCSSMENEPSDFETLKKMIESEPAVRCDQPSFVFLGLSMAGWNVIYCLGLFIFSIFFLRKVRK